ncbi:hypothetical protein EI171_04045 [Bradyrhizobium sp. LCT2]|nr:hypothetical protein EI171_04045 [Bradyrhizobium sp. LCT2]
MDALTRRRPCPTRTRTSLWDEPSMSEVNAPRRLRAKTKMFVRSTLRIRRAHEHVSRAGRGVRRRFLKEMFDDYTEALVGRIRGRSHDCLPRDGSRRQREAYQCRGLCVGSARSGLLQARLRPCSRRRCVRNRPLAAAALRAHLWLLSSRTGSSPVDADWKLIVSTFRILTSRRKEGRRLTIRPPFLRPVHVSRTHFCSGGLALTILGEVSK